MTHSEGEKKIKTIQKEFLAWVEYHPELRALDPEVFNDVRHRVFRSTFFAFRLGVVGPDSARTGLYNHFFGWLPEMELDSDTNREVAEKCFVTALESFWVGALVGHERRGE